MGLHDHKLHYADGEPARCTYPSLRRESLDYRFSPAHRSINAECWSASLRRAVARIFPLDCMRQGLRVCVFERLPSARSLRFANASVRQRVCRRIDGAMAHVVMRWYNTRHETAKSITLFNIYAQMFVPIIETQRIVSSSLMYYIYTVPSFCVHV